LLVMSSNPPAAARARIFTVDTGRFTPVRGLPAGGCLGGGTRVLGTSTWVIEWQPTPGAQLCVGSQPGSRYLIDTAGNARRLGPADYEVPAGNSSFWTVSGVDRPPDQQVKTPQRVQRVGITGAPLSRIYKVPVGWTLTQGLTPDVLLLARQLPTDGSRNWALWRPSTGAILDQYDRVLAAGPTVVAWVADSCAPDRCPLHLSPTSGGLSQLVALPRHAYAFDGSLSDDGHFLAVNLGTRSDAQNATSQDTGAVVDLTTRRLHLISATKVPASEQGGLTLNWAGPHWLMAGAQGADGQRHIAAFNPTTGSFVVAQHDLPAGTFPIF
jgi:hypothetical protein